ncbi:MAG: hypothetical protein GY822_20870 [Deltaproteobacteria bacterium]|nr:hypothetical protein [Deltaproteobacteria bacterium]
MGVYDDDFDDNANESTGYEGSSGFSGKVPDFVRKAIMTGIGAVFTTEEGVRSALGDIKLPKDAMGYLVSQADRTKRELIHTLARELRTFLDGLEVEDLVQKSLAGTTFEINTTIRVIAKEEGGVGLELKKKDMGIVKDEDKPAKKTAKRKAVRKKTAKKGTAKKTPAKKTKKEKTAK